MLPSRVVGLLMLETEISLFEKNITTGVLFNEIDFIQTSAAL